MTDRPTPEQIIKKVLRLGAEGDEQQVDTLCRLWWRYMERNGYVIVHPDDYPRKRGTDPLCLTTCCQGYNWALDDIFGNTP